MRAELKLSIDEPATLYILKKKNDPYPIELLKKRAESDSVAILLIQDAVELELPELAIPCYVLSDDLKPSQESPFKKIAYPEMLAMIFKAEAVLVW